MANKVYELNGAVVMDVEVDGVFQARQVEREVYGHRLDSLAPTPLSYLRPVTHGDERLITQIGGPFRIITLSSE